MRYPRLSFTAISLVAAVSLAGCSAHSNADKNAAQATPLRQTGGTIPVAPANDPDAQASALMAAAEPFENLTESAFISDTRKLDDFIAKAKSSADGASKLLSHSEAKVLADHVAAIGSARTRNNRADLAIAAVEGYRTLVSNTSSNMKVPKQVSLLDYAGFRYQADLKAAPVRWSDTASAVDFADAQWKQISATVSDAALRKKMSDALAAMRSATQSKNAKAAMDSSKQELDLVDGLEKYFAHA